MAEIFEEARVRFILAIGIDFKIGENRRLVVSLNHTYHAEALYPQPIEIGNSVMATGRTSWTLGQAAFPNATCVALCDITVVNASGSGPTPIGDRRSRARIAEREPVHRDCGLASTSVARLRMGAGAPHCRCAFNPLCVR
jgi:hypothetical protein